MEASDKLRAPAALTPGNSPRHPCDKGLSGPQSWSGGCGEEKILLPLPGNESWP
jgi:hypothetical protein